MAGMIERHTGTQPIDAVARADGSALAVDLAVVALSAGAPVVVQASDGPAVLTQALDGLRQAHLVRFRSLAPRGHRVVLSHRRLVTDVLIEDADGDLLAATPSAWAEAATLQALATPPFRRAPAPGLLTDPRSVASDGCEAAAVALAKLGGLLPAVLAAPAPWASNARPSSIDGVPLLAVDADAVFRHPEVTGWALRAVGGARVPLALAENSRIVVFRSPGASSEHVAIVVGEPEGVHTPLVRMHSACFTGDILGSMRCDCGEQLHGALARFAEIGDGVLLYLAQEGRGIGLLNKMRAYQLQDGGLDTIDANEELGFASDERVYHPAAAMLRALGITRVRLLTNNPDKVTGLAACGITVVERVPHSFPANKHNAHYLRTKAMRGGHSLSLDGHESIASGIATERGATPISASATPPVEGPKGR